MSDVVRPAVPADAAGIHAVHRASWLETYSELHRVGAGDETLTALRMVR